MNKRILAIISLALCFLFAGTSSLFAAQAVLSWDANPETDLAGYKLYYSTTSGNYTSYIDAGKVPSSVVTGLKEGETYYFAVTAVDLAGNETGYSNEVSKAIDTTLPIITITSPANQTTVNSAQLTVTGIADDNVGVSSVTVNGATATLTSTGGMNQPNEVSYSADITLIEGANTITVTAQDAAGNQAQAIISVTYVALDTIAPTVPADFIATVISSSQINLSWTAATDNVAVTGYNIYKNGVLAVTLPPSALSYSDTGLTAGTTYSYTISAFDAAGNESAKSKAAIATTLASDIIAPPIINAGSSSTTSTSTTISWTTNETTDTRIEYGTSTFYGDTTPVITRKWNPGHYVDAIASDTMQTLESYLSNPYITGVKVGQAWGDIESSEGVYDFTLFDTALSIVSSYDKQLYISVGWKVKRPAYLDALGNNRIWSPAVTSRFNLLIKALGERYDNNMNFEGIHFSESAYDLTAKDINLYGYTPDGYRDALNSITDNAVKYFPESVVTQYLNYAPDNSDQELFEVYSHLSQTTTGNPPQPKAAGLGNPDLVPDAGRYRPYRQPTYDFYDDAGVTGVIPLGISNMDSNYFNPDWPLEYCPTHPSSTWCKITDLMAFRPNGGTPALSSSGTTVTGINTAFLSEFYAPGMVIVNAAQTEARAIKSIESNTSLTLYSAFTNNLNNEAAQYGAYGISRKGDFTAQSFWDMGLNTLKLNYIFWANVKSSDNPAPIPPLTEFTYRFEFERDFLPLINQNNGDINKAIRWSNILRNLTPNTTYHYRIISTDRSNNVTTSRDYTFTTLPPEDPAPPATTVLPVGGIYTSAQTITLSCNDGTGSGCANTYYTTDGETPTTASTVYASPIQVTSSITLKYFSVDNAGNEEGVRTEDYIINNPPTISVITDQSTDEDTAKAGIAFIIGDTETPAGDLALSASSSNTTLLPQSHIQLGGTGENKTITLTPALNQSGTSNITLTVTDEGNLSAASSFVLTVNPVNDAPVAINDNYSVNEDNILSVEVNGVLNNDTDDGALTSELVSSTANGDIVLNSDGSFTYTPKANFNGSDSFTYKAQDTGGLYSNEAAVTLTINPVNDAPVLTAIGSKTVEENSLLSVTLSAADADTGDTLTYSSSALPQGANISGNTFTWTPDYTQAGTYNVIFTVTDGKEGSTDSEIITLEVLDVDLTAKTYFVRPYKGTGGGLYGDGSGSSYINAFNGFQALTPQVWNSIKPGNTLYICGTHTIKSAADTDPNFKNLKIMKSGTQENPIFIDGYCMNGNIKDYAIVDGGYNDDWQITNRVNNIVVSGVSWVTLRNFDDIRRATYHGIYVTAKNANTSDIVIENVTTRWNDNSGVCAGSMDNTLTYKVSNVLVKNSLSHDNYKVDENGNASASDTNRDHGGSGFQAFGYNQDGITFENNTAYNNGSPYSKDAWGGRQGFTSGAYGLTLFFPNDWRTDCAPECSPAWTNLSENTYYLTYKNISLQESGKRFIKLLRDGSESIELSEVSPAVFQNPGLQPNQFYITREKDGLDRALYPIDTVYVNTGGSGNNQSFFKVQTGYTKNITFKNNISYGNRHDSAGRDGSGMFADWWSEDVTITGNKLYDNQANGLSLLAARNITVRDNEIYNNSVGTAEKSGIRLMQCTYNVLIENNNIYANGFDGIDMKDASHDIAISNNIIRDNNRYGINNSDNSATNITINNNAMSGNVLGDFNFIEMSIPPVTTASPVGGKYTSAQSITLICDDGTGSGCASTYYTTDGGTPTTASTVYNSPIQINSNTTLKYFSIDKAGYEEEVRAEDYIINNPPVAYNHSVDTNEDTAKEITLTASDLDGDTLAYIITSPPSHGDISGEAPNLTYTPALNYNGEDSFSFKVYDGFNYSNKATVTITVNPVNDAPIVTEIPDQIIMQGETFSPIALDDFVTDIDTPDSDIFWTTNPLFHLTVIMDINRILKVSVKDPKWTGDEDITFSASDGNTFVYDTAKFTVAKPDQPPTVILTSDKLTVMEEELPVRLTVKANDPDGDPVTSLKLFINGELVKETPPFPPLLGGNMEYEYIPSDGTAPLNGSVNIPIYAEATSGTHTASSNPVSVKVEDTMKGDSVVDNFIGFPDLFDMAYRVGSNRNDGVYNSLLDFNNDGTIDKTTDIPLFKKVFFSGPRILRPAYRERNYPTISGIYEIFGFAKDPSPILSKLPEDVTGALSESANVLNLKIDLALYNADGSSKIGDIFTSIPNMPLKKLAWDTTKLTNGTYTLEMRAHDDRLDLPYKGFDRTGFIKTPVIINNQAGVNSKTTNTLRGAANILPFERGGREGYLETSSPTGTGLPSLSRRGLSVSSTDSNIYANITELPNNQIKAEIMVSALADLHNLSFDITFDPAKLSAVSVEEGSLLKGGGETIFISDIDNIDKDRVSIGAVLLGRDAGVSEGGNAANIIFTVKTAEKITSSALSFENADLRNSKNEDIIRDSGSGGGNTSNPEEGDPETPSADKDTISGSDPVQKLLSEGGGGKGCFIETLK